jgi:hypothetical protein
VIIILFQLINIPFFSFITFTLFALLAWPFPCQLVLYLFYLFHKVSDDEVVKGIGVVKKKKIK